MENHYMCLFTNPYYGHFQSIPAITNKGIHEERWELSRIMDQLEDCIVSRAFENYPENLPTPIASNPTLP